MVFINLLSKKSHPLMDSHYHEALTEKQLN